MSKVNWKSFVESCVYATAGIVIEVQESLPKMAEKGRASLEPRLSVARYVGQFAITNVERELQRQSRVVTEQLSDLVSGLFGFGDSASSFEYGADEGEADFSGEPITQNQVGADMVPDEPVDLPISGYTTLSAQQVIMRLASLSSTDADVIGIYEAKHRNRASILRAVASLKQHEN